MKNITKETVKFKLREIKSKIAEMEQNIDYTVSYEEINQIIKNLKQIEECSQGTRAMVEYELERSYLAYNNPINDDKIKYLSINKHKTFKKAA